MYPSDMSWSIDWKPHVEHREGTSTKKLAISGPCRTNNQILYDTEVTFRAVEFLRYELLEPKGSPVLPACLLHPAARVLSVDSEVSGSLQRHRRSTCRSLPDEDQHPVAQWLKIHHGIDQYPPSEEIIRESRRAYYAMITHVDEMIGEIVDELKHLGLYDDTIIAFVSDHGDMLGERQMWFKRTFHEPSVKVPFIFHCPKRFAPSRVREVVSLADLCPTFAELAGAKDAHDQFGSGHSQSFVGLLQGESGGMEGRSGDRVSWPRRRRAMARPSKRGDYKYVYCRNAPPMLFNIADDPDEMVDLSRTTQTLR